MRPENRRQPKIELAPSSDTKGEIKLVFFIATAMCISSAIASGVRVENIGGLVALGMGALATLKGLTS